MSSVEIQNAQALDVVLSAYTIRTAGVKKEIYIDAGIEEHG